MKNNLYLIIGEDNELVNFYLTSILENTLFNEEEKIEYDMTVSSISDILDEASMISLFSSKKIIIGREFDTKKMNNNDLDYLKRYIDNINKDVYIVLIAKKIDARSKEYKIFKDSFKVIETDKNNDSDKDILKYIDSYILDKGYRIDRYNLEYLLSKLGNNIDNIKIELDKIFLYLDNDKEINREVIDLLISDNIDNIIYEFTNAVLDKDYDTVMKMYSEFKIENIGYDYLLVSLDNVFRQALIIKMLYNQGSSNSDIAKVIGKKEFYVKKMLERLYNYSEDELARMIDRLAIIDRDYKSGKSNIDMLELFLIGKK